MNIQSLLQKAFCIVLIAAPIRSLQAAGFSLYEAGARGTAMGGAVVGETGDASANFYNPANLTDLSGTHFLAGATLVHPVLDITVGGEKSNLDSDWFCPPHVYGSQQVAENWFLGMGIYSEYGLGTKYDNDWPLKSSSTETTVETLTLNPNVAYKVTDRLSVAAGVRAMYLSFDNMKTAYDHTQLNPPYPLYGDMRTHIEGDSWGYGYVLALAYKVSDTLDAGFVYRSRVLHTVKGDIHVASSSTPVPNLLPSGSADARGELELPPSWTAGVNYHPVEKLNIGLSAIYTEWSTYDNLTMTFGNGTDNGTLPDSSEDKNWHNVWRFGIGAEYLLSERWSVQCGYVYDMDPIDKDHTDTMLPPGDRHIVSAGLGYAIQSWTINGSYGLIIMEPVDRMVGATAVDFDDGFCHLISLSVGKRF